MDIREFVEERVDKNHLSIDVDTCIDTISKYGVLYPEASEMKRFFHYVLNTVGGILNAVDHECTEMLGSLKVRGRGDITFFEFDHDEDYRDWLGMRLRVYNKIVDVRELRLLNYVELSTMNMISDIFTECLYELIDVDGSAVHFKKTGYGTDRDKQSFIKFLGTNFKKGYTFRPLGS
jgi:hypothetical protein